MKSCQSGSSCRRGPPLVKEVLLLKAPMRGLMLPIESDDPNGKVSKAVYGKKVANHSFDDVVRRGPGRQRVSRQVLLRRARPSAIELHER